MSTAKTLVGAVKNSMTGNNKNNGSVLSQKDITKVIQARVDNIMKAIEDIAVKAANTTAVNTAVQEIDKSLTNFANSLDSKSFKGLWGRFFKFKWNVNRLVKMTNSLQKITKDAEPGVKAISTISFIAQSLSEVCENIGEVKVPTGSTRKVKRMVKVINGLRVIIEDMNAIGPLLKKSSTDFKLLKTLILDLKVIFDSLRSIHAGPIFRLKMQFLIGSLSLVQRVIRKVANMKRIGAALRKIVLIKLFFDTLALMFVAITLLTPVFVLAPVALLVVAIAVWVLGLVLKLVKISLRRAAFNATISLLYMTIIFLSLVLITAMLLTIAILAKPILKSALWIIGLLLFIVVLAAILIVIGNLVTSLSILIVPALVGLLGVMVMIGMLVGITLLVALLVAPSILIVKNIGNILLMVMSLIPIMLSAVALGMIGIMAWVAVGFMAGNVALITSLYLIVIQIMFLQSVKLDADLIKKKIDDIKNVVTHIKEAFGGFEFDGREARVAKRGLRRVKRIIRQIQRIVFKLNHLQSFKLNNSAIKKNINSVWKVVDQIEAELEGHIDKALVSGSFLERWKARGEARRKANQGNKMLKRVKRILKTVHSIIRKLDEIQSFKLNERAITDNIKRVFLVVDDIEDRLLKNETLPANFDIEDIKDFFKKNIVDNIARKAGMGKLKRTDAILGKVLNITNTLNEIQNVTLNEDTVKSNLEMLFRFVDFIENYIKEQDKLPDDWTVKDLIGNFKKRAADNLQAKAAEGNIGKSEAILLKLKNMTDSLKSIQEMKIDTALAMEKVKLLFAASNELFDFVMSGASLNSKEAELMSQWYSQDAAGNSAAAKNTQSLLDSHREEMDWRMTRTTEHFNKVESILTLVTGVADKFKAINEINISPEKTKNKITLLFSAVDSVMEIVNNNSYSELDTEEFDNKYSTILDVISELNGTMSDLAQVDSSQVSNQKKMLDNYSKFIDKVNTIDIEKVKTTADMFGQMVKFSESVSGDFDKLAESINEKLMPVLEELKNIMTEIPDKLETGFANTSASIGAVGKSTDAAGMSAQVTRENPGISKEELDKIVQERLDIQDKENSKNTIAKIDEVIKLLRGQTGTVKVKTSAW